jgi:hypothetical protein
MNHIYKYRILAIFALLVITFTLKAQVNSLYFMQTVSTRHEFNPAFQPLPNLYIGLPSFYFGMNSNSLIFNDFIYPVRLNDGTYQTVWFMDKLGNPDDFYRKLKKNMHLYTDAGIEVFSFGLRLNNSYLTAGMSLKTTLDIFVPKSLFRNEK